MGTIMGTSYIKNSFELKDKIKNIIVPAGYTIISLDVVSLYTNIDNKLVYSAIKKFWKHLYNLIINISNRFLVHP